MKINSKNILQDKCKLKKGDHVKILSIPTFFTGLINSYPEDLKRLQDGTLRGVITSKENGDGIFILNDNKWSINFTKENLELIDVLEDALDSVDQAILKMEENEKNKV